MRTMKTVMPAAAVLLLAACAGPRPEAPADSRPVMPAAWRDGSHAEVPPGAQWWTAFGDPALTRLVDIALAHNPDVAGAAARVLETQAALQLSQAQQDPNIVGEVDGGRQSSVNAFGKQLIQNPRQAQVILSYELDLFDRLAHASAAARAGMLASIAAQETVRLAVAATAANLYIGLRSLDARLALLHETLASRAESLRIARRRAGSGYAPALELRQAEAEYHATAQLIPATELAVARQENALSILLGAAPRQIERGLPLRQLGLPDAPAGLPSSLLRRRPDIAAAEQQLAAADSALDAARDAFMPAIRLTASGGYADSDAIANPVKLFLLGGSVLAPLFDSGRLRAQADGAAARRDQAAYAYRKTTLTAMREVEDAMAAVSRNQAQEQELLQQRKALQQLLDIAVKRYRSGYASYLEQVDAQRSLLAAELNVLQAHADRLATAVTLFQSLGGGWEGRALTTSK
jgi:multidrug efflux system outer membrane protein